MTDLTGYVAQRVESSSFQFRFTVITRFQNRGAVPLYLGRCFPNSPTPIFGVEAADGSSTQSAYDRMWACVGHDQQFEVLPGAVRIDTLVVEGPTMIDGYSHLPIGVFEGAFLLHFDVQLARGDGGVRALDAVSRSNAFIVRTAK